MGGLGQPGAERFARRQHMGFHDATRLAPVATFHGIEQGSVLAPAPLLLFGKQLEVVAGHDPLGLAHVGEEPG